MRSVGFVFSLCLFASLHTFAADPASDRPADTESAKSANGRLERVLVFSGTGWYRHPQIPASNGWLVRLGADHGVQVDVTETPADITPEQLAQYQVLLLNNANELAKVLDEKQRDAIRKWYQQGGGIVGLHAALVHQQGWPWFNELAGCDFNSDSTFVRARVVVDPKAKGSPLVPGEENEFWYQADWHNHDKSVTGLPGVRVLMRLDESTFEPVRDYFKTRGGKAMGADHPMTWTREHDGGRFFYTELGHDVRSLDTPFGKKLIIEALRWTADTK